MRGGSLGHVLVFVVAVRYISCLFVCAACFACFISFGCDVCWSVLLFVSCCDVCVVVLLVMSRCVWSLFVMSCAYLSVLFVLLVLLVWVAMFDGGLLLSASWCIFLRGVSPGHILVFVIAVRFVMCVFVCVGCFACGVCLVVHYV